MKIIVDTNIWISYFISKSFNELFDVLMDDQIRIAFSTELLKEIKEVTSRPKISKIIDGDKVEEIINLIFSRCEFCIIQNIENVCRDKGDDFLLSLSETFNADYLITGDNDLLVMDNHKDTKIIKWADFISEVKNK